MPPTIHVPCPCYHCFCLTVCGWKVNGGGENLMVITNGHGSSPVRSPHLPVRLLEFLYSPMDFSPPSMKLATLPPVVPSESGSRPHANPAPPTKSPQRHHWGHYVNSLEQPRETPVPDEHPRVGNVCADISVSPRMG